MQILRQILLGSDIGYNKDGFFLAASGSIAWNDIYDAFAKALARRGVVDDSTVEHADETALKGMAEALGVDPSIVPFQVGGKYVTRYPRSYLQIIVNVLQVYLYCSPWQADRLAAAIPTRAYTRSGRCRGRTDSEESGA